MLGSIPYVPCRTRGCVCQIFVLSVIVANHVAVPRPKGNHLRSVQFSSVQFCSVVACRVFPPPRVHRRFGRCEAATKCVTAWLPVSALAAGSKDTPYFHKRKLNIFNNRGFLLARDRGGFVLRSLMLGDESEEDREKRALMEEAGEMIHDAVTENPRLITIARALCMNTVPSLTTEAVYTRTCHCIMY